MVVFLKHLHFWILLKCGLSDNSAFVCLPDTAQLDLDVSCPLLMQPVFLSQSPPLPVVSDPTCFTHLPVWLLYAFEHDSELKT